MQTHLHTQIHKHRDAFMLILTLTGDSVINTCFGSETKLDVLKYIGVV